jgi:long-subunit fatty acid transport protein
MQFVVKVLLIRATSNPMKFLAWIWIFIPVFAHSSYFETFGASAKSMAMGGQISSIDQAESNYYHPAIMGLSKRTGYSLNLGYVSSALKKMDDIVVLSPVNSNKTSSVYRDLDPNTDDLTMLSGHGVFNFYPDMGIKLGLSFTTEINRLYDSATLDPYLPEYVNFKNRLNRPLFAVNLAKSFGQTAYALGFIASTKASGNASMVATENGDAQKSSGVIAYSAAPVTAPTFSIARKYKEWLFALSYQRYLRSKLETSVEGYTPIGVSSLPYALDMQTTMFFDPTIIRLGSSRTFRKTTFSMTLEYQIWDEFESPILKLKNTGGIIQGSTSYQSIDTQNILIPKLGLSYQFNSKHTMNLGLQYRPSAIDSDLKNNGTLIDPETTSFALGHSFQWQSKATFNTTLHYTHIHSQDVEKSAGTREDGTAGDKLGAPGYEVAGHLIVLSFGLNWLI